MVRGGSWSTSPGVCVAPIGSGRSLTTGTAAGASAWCAPRVLSKKFLNEEVLMEKWIKDTSPLHQSFFMGCLIACLILFIRKFSELNFQNLSY